MGKADFFSPKAVANRQKARRLPLRHRCCAPQLTPPRVAQAKGLQKLRWYCQARSTPSKPTPLLTLGPPQVCQKQCRDENGFKCHTSSEGHLRQARAPAARRAAPC